MERSAEMSVNRGWKQFERRVGKLLGGERTWKDDQDFETDLLSGECKLLGVIPKFLYDRLKQADRNCPKDRIPICVVKERKKNDVNAIVIMRLGEFVKILKKGGIIDG